MALQIAHRGYVLETGVIDRVGRLLAPTILSDVTDHVVIRRKEYVAGTADHPEVGVLTQTHARRPPVPWGRIAVGDTVWMKWSGGPVVARATVQGYAEFRRCTPAQLRRSTSGYGLHDMQTYWDSLPLHFYAVVVYLEDEVWLGEKIIPDARTRGESWVVLDSPGGRQAWLTGENQVD